MQSIQIQFELIRAFPHNALIIIIIAFERRVRLIWDYQKRPFEFVEAFLTDELSSYCHRKYFQTQ
jgi:hypothetical protein